MYHMCVLYVYLHTILHVRFCILSLMDSRLIKSLFRKDLGHERLGPPHLSCLIIGHDIEFCSKCLNFLKDPCNI